MNFLTLNYYFYIYKHINKIIMSKEEIQEIYDYSTSKLDIINKLNIKQNQNGISIDKDILKYFSQIGITEREQISKKNLSKHWLEIQKRDYDLNPKKCLNCNQDIPFERRNYDYCCASCGISFGNKKRGKRTEIEKLKISISLRKYNKNAGHCNISERIDLIKQYYNNEISLDQIKQIRPEIIRTCKECGKEYVPKLKNNASKIKISGNKFCSKYCHDKSVSEFAKNLRKTEIINGTFKGWNSRNILSYPEKFWIKVLNNNNITYIANYPVKQENGINNWFLDFYIELNNKKIDLEIDGKQHKYKDRIESDTKRDIYIKSLGYEVYRIEWNEINSESGKDKMKHKINHFLEYIKQFN